MAETVGSARAIIAEFLRDDVECSYDQAADAIIAALSEAGLVIVPRETGDVVRQARCPSDGRHLVGECYDAKTCGCTIGLHLAALLAARGYRIDGT